MLELIAKFSADTSGLKKGVGDAKKQMRGFEGAIQKVTGVSAQSSRALKQFGAVAVGTAIAVGVQSVKAFAKFEKGMAEVGTLTKFNSKEMRAMSQETLKMARTFGQNIGTLTKARYDIVSAGFKSITEQTQFLTQANKLAIAGVTDVSVATDALTSVVGAYGREMISAEQASDILFATVRAGKTTIDELAPAIGKVLPTAKAAGVSFEEVGASLATLTAVGISTPQAVTALNSALFALGAPTKEAKEAMKEMGSSVEQSRAALEGMGIQTVDASGKMLPLVDVVAQFEGMTLEEIRKVIPDKEAAKAILAAANNMDIFRANTEAMVDVAGVTQEAYEKMAETTAQKLAVLNSSFDVLKTTFGAFISDNRSGIDVLGFTTGVLNDWSRLLTLDESGVSALRREWRAFIDDPLVAVKAFIIENVDTEIDKANQKIIDSFFQANTTIDQATGKWVANVSDAANETQRKWIEAEVARRNAAETTNDQLDKLNQKTIESFLDANTTINKSTGQLVADIQKGTSETQKAWVEAEVARRNAAMESDVLLRKQIADQLGNIQQTEQEKALLAEISNREIAASNQAAASSLTSSMASSTAESTEMFDGFIQDITGEVVDVNTNMETSAALQEYRDFITGLPKTVTLTAKIRTVQEQASGGFVYGFAGGGIASTDTVPAMLTPGEFVVRRESVRGNEAALRKLNATGGFARGGLVQGFQEGGAVGTRFATILQPLGEFEARAVEDISQAFEFELQAADRRRQELERINQEILESQAATNQEFLDMMNEFQQGVTNIQLAAMDEREQLFFEKQETLSAILQGPYSEEQKELLVANATAFYDAQIMALEEAAVADREQEELDARLANYDFFFRTASAGFDTFFKGVIGGEKKFGVALGEAFKQQGAQLIDFGVKKLVTEQAIEEFIAAIQAPNTFGASALKIPLIIAAAAAGKAALGAIKFHEGGIVGGDINAPPRDVPIVAQAGEAVVDRDTTRDLVTGGGTERPIEITIVNEWDGDEISRNVALVRPEERFA
jgi:TP901 family phage tail tape measure protein